MTVSPHLKTLTRIGRLLRNDLWLEWRGYLVTAASVAGIAVLIWGVLPTGVTAAIYTSFLYPAVLVLGGFLFASRGFSRLHAPHTAIDYLMLPARQSEKFVSRLLQTVVFYPAGTVLLCVLISVLVMLTQMLLGRTPAGIYNPFTKGTLHVTVFYLTAHAAFLAGSAYFATRPFVKTVLTAVGFVLATLVYVAVLARVLLLDLGHIDWVRMQQLAMLDWSAWGDPLKVVMRVAWYATAPLLWAATYLRMRETEV